VPGGRPSTAPTVPTPPKDPVTIRLSDASVSVGPDTVGRFDVTLQIDPGFHVNANDPGLDELVGLTLQVVGRGVALEAQYPAGETFRTRAFADHAIRVYTGSVTIPVTVTQVGSFSRPPRIVLTYQVCTDEVCLRPARSLLPVTITPAD